MFHRKEQSMDSGVQALSAEESQRRDALVGRLFQSVLGAMDLFHVYLGSQLGLYDALGRRGWATSAELAGATQLSERYVREWLEQQAVSGLLDVEDVGADAHSRRYTLSPGHAEVLLSRDSLNYSAPSPRIIVSLASQLPAVAQAFRNGGGVLYEEYGADARESIAEGNRVFFLNLLGSSWFPAIPDVHTRLQADPPARVADIGCGSGWSSIAIARAYPKVQVEGFDIDEPSVALALANAGAEGLTDRVNFTTRDAADPALEGTFDLVVAFECIHDMARPVEALRAMRSLVAHKGAVIIADERVADTFTAPGDDIERYCYGFSALHCLAVGMVEQPSAGTGTVMRPDTLRGYATDAGFSAVEVLPVAFDFWRFYRLVP
jgi:2-polyprenyl-3-methyl-5-hydroxy-6-metoxy-1,4-benzoquinol methylase